MKVFHSINPIVRATAVFAVIAAAVAGTTFAGLQSRATLTNNTISSATSQLQVKSSGGFASQDAGFAFNDVVPGGDPMPQPGHSFQLRNNGNRDLAMFVSVPTAPVFTTTPASATVDLSKVYLVIACNVNGNAFNLDASMASLVTAYGTGGVAMTGARLPSGTNNIANCTAQVRMDNSAFQGESVSSTSFNVVFTGSARSNTM